MSILVLTQRAKEIGPFAEALSRSVDHALFFAADWAAAEARLRENAPHFLVIDQGLPEGEPLELARRALMVNAMVNMAVVSTLGQDDFHEASEGLGILAPVPASPGPADGAALGQVFKRFL